MSAPTGEVDRTNIPGKVVVITGASSGSGEATARYLADRGATVVLGARRVERLNAVADEITKGGGKALAIHGDRYPAHLQARVGR
jgi:NADP-dependent 3-hydroxy acid dehydrogenase YdfG